jgi:hypothetical protein
MKKTSHEMNEQFWKKYKISSLAQPICVSNKEFELGILRAGGEFKELCTHFFSHNS